MKGYRVGWLGWKIAAKFGFPLVIKGKIFFDDKDKVWVATSNDFLPAYNFVCEGETFDELVKEIPLMAYDVLDCVFERESILKQKESRIVPEFKPAFPMAFA